MTGNARLKIKIQFYCADEIAMGPGKADLLEAIREHGSISGAGRAMNMSYRRAWLLVDAMNRCWSEPLVHTIPGGAASGGAHLTATGEQVLSLYRSLQHRLLNDTAASKELQALEAGILAQPRRSQKA